MAHLKPEECLSFFSEVLTLLKSTHVPEKVLSLIVDRLVRVYACQTCAVIKIDPETEYLRIISDHNLSHLFVNRYKVPIGTGAIAKLLFTGRPILITDALQESELAEEIKLEHRFRSAVCLQISAEMRTLGYLFVDSKESNAFSTNDLRNLQSFADLISITINKAYLYEKNLKLDKVDHETGLEKYAPFLERLSASIVRAKENNECLVLLMLDIDNYRQIEGTYGFESSKLLLREIAGLIKSKLRHIDAASRYGFDEIIILRETISLDEGIKFAGLLRQMIEQTEFTPKKIKTTVSIGVAEFPKNANSEKDLMLSAKEALYDAQRSGKNRVAHI